MKMKKNEKHKIMKIITKNRSYGCDINKLYNRYRYEYTKYKNRQH